MRIKFLVLVSAIALGSLGTSQAHAAGCVSGGVVGGVAGHVAGHHALLGAVGGCIAGHEINKHNKKMQQQAEQTGSSKP